MSDNAIQWAWHAQILRGITRAAADRARRERTGAQHYERYGGPGGEPEELLAADLDAASAHLESLEHTAATAGIPAEEIADARALGEHEAARRDPLTSGWDHQGLPGLRLDMLGVDLWHLARLVMLGELATARGSALATDPGVTAASREVAEALRTRITLLAHTSGLDAQRAAALWTSPDWSGLAGALSQLPTSSIDDRLWHYAASDPLVVPPYLPDGADRIRLVPELSPPSLEEMSAHARAALATTAHSATATGGARAAIEAALPATGHAEWSPQTPTIPGLEPVHDYGTGPGT
ncbi:hypothetical protein IU487_33700 [Nocardia puris]|uniref:hypothetical protein n=1 Tax=Nocardia puris TaxID=208602 RepID=UPI001893B2BC|nr:hypothetical protein [Nocardia puris]MBF6215956.1 hypothetical protein [Nocardia puris]